MPTPTDPLLLDRLAVRSAAGDHQAFTELILATEREVRLFAAARTPSRDLLEEVVQSTYVTAWERMAEYSGGGRLDSWLKGIALNRIRGEARHRRRMTGGDRIAELIQPEEPDTGPDDEVQRLAECLERLGPQARRLLECRYRDGMALTDLARRFRRTAGALAVALHRLRHGLRQCLGRA